MTAPHNNSPSRFSFAAERRKSTPFLAMSLSFQTRHSLAVLFLADVFVAFATEVTGCWVIRRDHSPPFSQRDRCVFDPASTHKTPASWPPGPALTHLRPTCVADHVVHTSPSFRPCYHIMPFVFIQLPISPMGLVPLDSTHSCVPFPPSPQHHR